MQNDKWEIYQDNKKEWRWRRTASNGKIVGRSTEGYKKEADCIKNAEHFGYNGKYNPAGQWEFYQDKRKEWRWRHFAASTAIIIGASSEGYKDKKDALANAQKLGYKGA